MPLRVGCRADDSDKHSSDVNYMLYHRGKLYTAGDDGKIIAWNPDLKKVAEVQSNPCSVYCLAGSEDSIYSCSNQGTIKAFHLDTLKEKAEISREANTEVWRIAYTDGCLYSGDSDGNVKVWKKSKFFGAFNIAEPVKDMEVYKNTLFTARDLDVVITEIKLEGQNLQYCIKTNFMGRAPLTLIGDKYFSFISREGLDINLHENNGDTHYKHLTKVQGSHEKIINGLAGAKWGDKYVLFSGGWDKKVKKWNIEGDTLKLDSACEVEIIVNAITIGDKGEIYVGGSDGHIVRIEIE